MDRGAIPLQVLDHSRASQATHPPTRWVLFSRRGGGDGISGLAPVSPRAKEEATHWVLFHDEGMATAFPASHLSRRGRRRKRRTGCCFTTRGWRRHFRPRTCHAEGEGGSDALGLFQDEGMATAFPASHLSRRGR